MRELAQVKASRPWLVAFFSSLTLAVGLVALFANHSAVEAESAPPPPNVDVVVLKPEKIRLWSEFSGYISAVDQVEVRPRVSGAIDAVLFAEGATVRAGDPLFIIDPRPYQAAIDNAKAALASAKSRAELAKLELARAKDLVGKKLISQSDYDISKSSHRVALADIDAAKASLKQAQLNYDYAHIRAPVSGRIGRAEMTQGNLVQSGPNAPVLTTIVANDRFYIEFDVDEQTYVKSVRNQIEDGAMPVLIQLAGTDQWLSGGKLHAFDNLLDRRSGTIRARALIDNDGGLLPGMFTKVRLGAAEETERLLISERAIGTNQDRKFVYVVDPEGTVGYQEVVLGRSIEDKRIVLSGLASGAQVIVNGLLRVRPNMKVTPIDVAQHTSPDERADLLAAQ